MIEHNLSDAELYQKCLEYGRAALEARRKFLGLLPEVNRRRLFLKHGCTSVFEFAAKVAGVSEEQVRRVLNLEKKFAGMPKLHVALVEGKVSVNKLVRIAGVANSENEQELAMQAEKLSKVALEVFVRDEKMFQSGVPGHTNLQQNLIDVNVQQDELVLAEGTRRRLLELQEKGIDINEIINDALDRRKEEILKEKNRLAVVADKKAKVHDFGEGWRINKNRYIPVEIKQVLKKEYGSKCAVPWCKKSAVELHHQVRFSLTGSHNPIFIKPLCEGHHQIAHAIDEKYLLRRKFINGGSRGGT